MPPRGHVPPDYMAGGRWSVKADRRHARWIGVRLADKPMLYCPRPSIHQHRGTSAKPREEYRPGRMYRCALCSQSIPPRTPARRLILETRSVVYPYRVKAHPSRFVGHPRASPKRHHVTSSCHDDPGGTGWEIVKEVLVCPACASAHLLAVGRAVETTAKG